MYKCVCMHVYICMCVACVYACMEYVCACVLHAHVYVHMLIWVVIEYVRRMLMHGYQRVCSQRPEEDA